MERQPNPSDDAIEAIIQHATSAASPPYSRPGGPLRDTRTQLFVGNLPYRVRWQDLKDLFRKAGTVLRADVSLGPDNRSRGYGTVLLATAEDAGRAVDTFNGYSWQSRILEVRLDRQLQEFDSPTPSTANSSYLSLLFNPSKSSSVTDDPDYPSSLTDSNSGRNLFVGNLPFHCQWQDLKDLFRQAGTITRADVVLGPDGRSRGFGTVVFATELDAERALKMFNGYDLNGRVLNVHRDKFPFSTETTSASPVPESSSGASSHPTHITLPPGYMIDLLPSSGPTSPYDMFKYQHHQHLYDQQQSQQQLNLQLQQHQHRPQHQQLHKHQHQHLQQRNLLYDTLDLPDTSSSILRSGTSSTQFHDFLPPSSSSSSRPPSTSAPITAKHPIPIPIYKPPSLSHTNTASSGSDRSEMFSRLSSTSATSAASSVSSSLSRPHSEGYSHGHVPGQGQRGQRFRTSSPNPVSSPKSPQHSHSGSHHSSSSSHSSSPHASQFSSSTSRSISRPPSSNPNHRPPQRPGPISLPPPLLPSQMAFTYPLQQLSPHVHTPHGMSVSVSVSPLVEYPGGYGYASGMYGQQQQFGQHMTPNGLPMTPSMPPFFLPPTIASGSHATPTGASMKACTGGGSSGGHRHTQSRSKSHARHLDGEVGENTRSNSNVSVNDGTSSPSVSPPPSSSARQRHHHQQHHYHHQNQQPSQPSYHQNPPPRRSAGGAGNSPNAHPIPNVSSIPQPQLHPISMHINLNSVPGAFSPGVVMSPGTFYGRPGEAPTFINAAVGAPLNMRGGGGGADMNGEGSAAVQEQAQAQQGQGQWYHQNNQTHGSYFYAMSSPKRRTPTGMEPKGYFDPLYFPAGVNVCGNGAAGGGYSSSVGGSGALVNEIMKDGRAESLGVEIGKEGGRGMGMGRKGEGEEETHISDDGDDEKDSGNDADDDDDDDSGELAEEGENQEAHDTDPRIKET